MTNIFKGDDLVDIITVNRPTGTDSLTITKDVVTVGNLVFPKDNPTFPYKITITRSQSKNLDYQNNVNRAIYYTGTDGTTTVRRTCIGTLILPVNKQVVPDVEDTED